MESSSGPRRRRSRSRSLRWRTRSPIFEPASAWTPPATSTSTNGGSSGTATPATGQRSCESGHASSL
ncbi:MAG: hypothetical protein CMJ65_11355, partial [Planctomycetaceae bacterium]|nr:hypothetical protein [Planctomycetaceae bacterium]